MKLTPGGPGAKSGGVYVGDKLKMIDDMDITQLPIEEFPALISGPLGSSVKLLLIRHGDGEGDALVHLTLTRGPCESSNYSGPRVLAVNPVHLIDSNLSSATHNSSTLHNYSSSTTLSEHGPAETTRLSPKHSAGVGTNFFVPDAVKSDPYITSGMPRGALLSSGSQLEARSNLSQLRASSISSAQNYATAPHIFTASGSSAMSMYDKTRVIGICFLNDKLGGLQVEGLAEGDPAYSSAALYQGDLVEIKGRDVRAKSVSDIQDEIVGPWNSGMRLLDHGV